ncbi:carboxymuconolactone decarboxylase family protein [Pseudoduganella sp. FT26W]|uniref:Carboxymuconolactone decarboxylase family protein n=1 Tax=Duganella aquatilis TaxID=2666082 RepID=A0A844CYB7_9BURK|nr:carboxymuconolactone decarboxylase family protein [Duganella aquatilis]MRW85433.1 carboxymuconolactone decarboxylase family protein [Duganella aquatilis]
MKPRIDYQQASPEAMQALIAFELAVLRRDLDPRLLQLVKLRASQINGCAYCIDIELAEARRAGESQARIDLLSVWRDCPLFEPRECAVLAWTEALTRMDDRAAIAGAEADMRVFFDEPAIADWRLAIASINCWNRMGVGFRKPLSQ